MRPPPKNEASLYLAYFAVRVIPLKPSPDKASAEKSPRRSQSSSGECSKTRAMATVFFYGSTLGRCRDASSFYCRTGATKKVKKIFLFNDLNSDIAGCRSQKRLALHLQDRVGCFRVLIEQVDSLGSRQHDSLDLAAFCLTLHLFHHRQSAVCAGADDELASLSFAAFAGFGFASSVPTMLIRRGRRLAPHTPRNDRSLSAHRRIVFG